MNWTRFIRTIENVESTLIKATHELLDQVKNPDQELANTETEIMEAVVDARAALQEAIEKAKKLQNAAGFTSKEPSA